ncbi:hypothetical protein L484_003185 [Morus notabilis]|uniref:Uncharacterized protein n=1 Tax=Morus notabilis TaxID=981085 RepID=W9RZG7_9ROSA|nr:hypothetical protein L484_003185 [Morus notabilis]
MKDLRVLFANKGFETPTGRPVTTPPVHQWKCTSLSPVDRGFQYGGDGTIGHAPCFGHDYDFLKVVAIVNVSFAFLFAIILAFAIMAFNFQRR